MKRKVALLMATLMAGSSLSGSYVSAASIEGRSEENVQSEETASENEDAGASELAESEIPLENETSQEEEEIQQAEDQEEDIEFLPEESVVLDEELYAEEEQFIEAEPVQMLMEDGEEDISDETKAQYSIELNSDTNRLYYGERGNGPLTITADTEGLDESEKYEINWDVKQYKNEQEEDVSCAEVSAEGTECTITVDNSLESGEYFDLKIQVTVKKDDEEIAADEMYIAVVPTELELGGLPQDDTILAGWDYTIDRDYTIWRKDASYPDGTDVSVRITQVRVVEDENELFSYDHEDEQPNIVIADEDGYYHLKTSRSPEELRYGEAVIEFDYAEPAGMEDTEHAGDYVSGMGSFRLCVEDEKYSTGYEYENGNENNRLLPGTSMNITTSLYKNWYDAGEDYEDGKDVEEYTLELQHNEDGTPAWNTELIDVEIIENNIIRVTAKATEENGETDIPVRFLVDDTEVGNEWIHISVYQQFCMIEPGYLTDENGKRLNPQVGGTLNLADIEFQVYDYAAGNEKKVPVEDVQYRVEYDPNVWQDISNNVDETGHGLPELKRVEGCRTAITVIADRLEEGKEEAEEIERQTYWIEERNYNIRFDQEEAILFYGARSAPVTITADTSNLEKEGLSGYRVVYEVTQYRNEQEENNLTSATYTTSSGEDGKWSCTLEPRSNFETEDEVYIRIHASIQNNKVTVAEAEMNIPVAATETGLDSLPEDRVMLPGRECEIESVYYIWRRDAEYPKGKDVPVQITGVRVLENENDVLDYKCNEEEPQTVLADEEGNYHLYAVRDNTQVRGGEAVIEYEYSEMASSNDPKNTRTYISGTGKCTISVGAERYDTGYEIKDNVYQLLPGSSTTITTFLFREWYDVDADDDYGEDVEEYTLELQRKEDGTPDWDSDLIDVKAEGKTIQVTAKEEKEGETDIPVRYLLGEDQVGTEWIHISVYNEFCILEPGYLTDDNGESLNPQAGETLNLAAMRFQTYKCSTENEEKMLVENVKYRVEYDSNAWQDTSENVDEDGFGLPGLKRISNWGTNITVLAYIADNEESIAEQHYWFDGYEYAYSYEYRMSEEELDYGYIYTDDVPLQVTLAVHQKLPGDATVEWEAVVYNEEEKELQAEWVTLETDETDPLHVQVKWVESTETESGKDYSFILKATVSNNEEELFRCEDEWIRVQGEQFEFQIPYLIYLTGNEPDPMKFRTTDRYDLYQQNGTCPKKKTELVKVTGVRELCEEGEELLSIYNENGDIIVTPKDDKRPGESQVEIDLEYEDGTSAGPVQIPVYIMETLTQVGEITFDSEGADTQLLPGQSLGMDIPVRRVWRNGTELEKEELTEGKNYTIEIDNNNPDIIEYRDGRFYAIGRGDARVTVNILDMDGNEIAAREFEVQVTGSYFKAEQGDSEDLMLAAGGASVEIPYSLRRYSISIREGRDVNPDNVVLESEDEDETLHISYKDKKIMASLDKSAELEKGENKEAQFRLKFLDEDSNVMASMPCTVTLHRHDLKAAAYKPATCIESGNQAYWICDFCGKVYGDATGQNETTIANQKINASGHRMKQTPAQAATCIAEGTEGYWTCQNCHQVFADQAGMNVTTIEARKTAKAAHSYGAYTVTKKATVLAEGEEAHTCTVCGRMESRTTAKLTGTIRLTANRLPLQVKKTVQLSRIVTDLADGDYIVSCTSQNPKAATVDNHGKVTAKAAGSTVITIQLASGVTAKVTINVQKKTVATSSIRNVSKTWNAKSGEKLQLSPVISPITTTDKVTYTSSNKKVATVSGKGLITAKKAGTAKITVKSGKKKFTVTVKVAAPQPTGINSVPAAKALKKGKSFTIKPKLTPSGAQGKISYSTSNKKVAAVNAKGKVTAKGAGTAVITVKAGNITKTCMVTVK